VLWFHTALVHTKGRWARTPFILADWQREGIIEPLFGNVRYDEDSATYVRSHTMGWIEVARKNGKSEMLAGIALYLLIMDGEEGAEIYGAARDRDQARIVWDVAERMCSLSPVIQRNASKIGLRTMSSTKRIIVASTGSFYTTVARDALGNLGQNPHGIVFDEIIAQPDDRLWNSMRTAMGARTQPLMVAATTAGDDLSSFAHNEHNECVRVQDDPDRAKHRFVYIRNLPHDADPWDEKGWTQANPALGDYLSINALRQEAEEARNDPSKENAFRQFRLNQWVNQATRWMPMHLYDQCEGEPWLRPDYRTAEWAGREAWVGLDLSARSDLTAMAALLPPKVKGDPAEVIFRFWLPEDVLPGLDQATSGQASVWVRDGWLTLHDGAVIDYSRLVDDITTYLSPFHTREITYDKWSGEPVRQALEASLGGGVTLIPNEPTFSGMTVPMSELMNLTTNEGWHHHNNPVARWCFDSVEVKRATENPDLIKPVKPTRAAGGKRIDGVVAAALAVGAWRARGAVPVKKRAVYGFR
jgi:phage terminase large subunit-like protein